MSNFKSILGTDMSPLGYGYSGFVIARCDNVKEKETVKIGGVDIFLNPEISNNHRNSHPQIGTVISSSGNNSYKKGDRIFCFHFSFTDENKELKRDVELDGEVYAKVINADIIGKIVDDEIIPRDGIILCSPVGYNKSLHTIENKRRDLLKVERVYDDCEDVKNGDYVLIEQNADYYFEFNGKEYVAVDYNFDDVIGVVDNINWEIDEIRKHVTDYSVGYA